jgi:hypothetical protein
MQQIMPCQGSRGWVDGFEAKWTCTEMQNFNVSKMTSIPIGKSKLLYQIYMSTVGG